MPCSRPCGCRHGAEPGVAVPIDAGSIISSAPTSSACPESANRHRRARRRRRRARAIRPSTAIARRCRGRSPARAGSQLASGRLRLAIPLPATVGVDDPYFFPLTLDALGHSAPQTHLAQRRLADRRDRARPRRRGHAGDRGRARGRPRHRPCPDRAARRRPGGRRPGRRARRRPRATARRRSCSPCSARSPAG